MAALLIITIHMLSTLVSCQGRESQIGQQEFGKKSGFTCAGAHWFMAGDRSLRQECFCDSLL